ncbi:PREDICTED: putative N-acetylglucosamine-6-phosphate deacetylase [Cyprinodon variegatus]|uniref:putative N-acetylglucosamine-6-phosphate deacetylase n=1 Tax=Cyprinodon variegatus TaxID=28743 RepID=UPI0007427C58|nr:PREDICTED: putative N-acetylglucosamine-6-phosphate deacetylase [Cyprinodon variegatus]
MNQNPTQIQFLSGSSRFQDVESRQLLQLLRPSRGAGSEPEPEADLCLSREDLWVREGKILDPEKLFFDEQGYADQLVDCEDSIIAPGFIDVQINGEECVVVSLSGLVLVTDAITAMGLPPGRHTLGQQVIEIQGLHAYVAGLLLPLLNVSAAVRAFSPCGSVDQLNLVLLDDALNVRATFISGEEVWKRDA